MSYGRLPRYMVLWCHDKTLWIRDLDERRCAASWVTDRKAWGCAAGGSRIMTLAKGEAMCFELMAGGVSSSSKGR